MPRGATTTTGLAGPLDIGAPRVLIGAPLETGAARPAGGVCGELEPGLGASGGGASPVSSVDGDAVTGGGPPLVLIGGPLFIGCPL